MKLSSRPTTARFDPLHVLAGLAVVVAPTLLVFLGLVGLAAEGSSPTGDKPLWKEKGKPTGAVHGSTGGQPFKDRAWGRLAEVSVRGGSWLDSVRCTWVDAGEAVKGDTHGGDGGNEAVVTLGPGETLLKVTGIVRGEGDDAVIGSLCFETNKQFIGPIGQTVEGTKFVLEAPQGQEICGLQGRSGDYLNAIGMVCRPKP